MARIISKSVPRAATGAGKQAPAAPARTEPAARTAAKSGSRRVPVEYMSLPVWRHEEHGSWKPIQGPPANDTERLYWDRMTALVERKWPELMPEDPVPEMSFARMKPADDLKHWCSVDMLIIFRPQGADWSAFLASLRDDNLFSFRDCGRYAYISPFFEWGLADYWEQGYYDR